MPNPSGDMSALRKRVRRIGFELEDGSWYAWRAVHGEPYRRIYFKTLADRSGVRPMVKHEVLHRSAGVRMEADEFDEDGMRLADVEFVTDPFPLSPQGHSDLVRALGHVERIYSTIAPMQGRDHAEGEFVGPERHHLSEQDVFLSRGKPGAQICVQSTLGLSLADIPQVYSAFGKRSQGWRNMHVFEPIRSASERALRLSLTRIRQSIGDDPSLDDPAALLGFLTALIAFLRGINAQPIRGGIKTYLPVMHRNDFATMFSLLHPSLRALLQSNQAHFVEAILAGVFGDPDGGIDDLDLAGFANQPVVKSLALTAHDRRTFTADLPLPTTLTLGRQGARIITYRPLPRTLSIEQWVKAWMSDAPVDLLTTEHFDIAQTYGGGGSPSATLDALRQAAGFADFTHLIDWSRSYEEPGYSLVLVFDWPRLSGSQQAILRDSVRQLGGLGAATDSAHPDLALFENRVFSSTKLGMDTVTEAVSSYFLDILGLLENSWP